MKRKLNLIITILLALMLVLPADTEVLAAKYKYYNLLNDRQQKMYKLIKGSFSKLRNSTATSNLKGSYSDILMSLSALSSDYPYYFSGNLSIETYLTGKAQYHLKVFDMPQKHISAAVKAQANSLQLEGDSDLETLLNIHNWLIDNVAYEDNYRIYQNAHSMLGVFERGKAVCEGYARTFKYLCDRYQIPCALVTGTGIDSSGSEPHMWNFVEVDGSWYAVDVTWDDNASYEICYTYFLAGASTLGFNGTTFEQSHIQDPSYQYFSDSSSKGFKFPKLSTDAHPMHAELNGTYLGF